MKRLFKTLFILISILTLSSCIFHKEDPIINEKVYAPSDFYIDFNTNRIYIKDSEGAISYRYYVNNKEINHIPDSSSNNYNQETGYHFDTLNLSAYEENIKVSVCAVYKNENKIDTNTDFISKDYIYIAPVDKATSTYSDGVISWVSIEHASSYEITNNNVKTNVTTSKFTLPANDTSKTINVRPIMEDGYFTKQTYISFSVLKTPTNLKYTPDNDISFGFVDGATEYETVIYDGNEIVIKTSTYTAIQYIPKTEQFSFKVRALSTNNQKVNSDYSETLEVDFYEPIIKISYQESKGNYTFLFTEENSKAFTASYSFYNDLEKETIITDGWLNDNKTNIISSFKEENLIALELKSNTNNVIFTKKEFEFTIYNDPDIKAKINRNAVSYGTYQVEIENSSKIAKEYKVKLLLSKSTTPLFESVISSTNNKFVGDVSGFTYSSTAPISHYLKITRIYKDDTGYDVVLNAKTTEYSKLVTTQATPTYLNLNSGLVNAKLVSNNLSTYSIYNETLEGINEDIYNVNKYGTAKKSLTTDGLYALPESFSNSDTETSIYAALITEGTVDGYNSNTTRVNSDAVVVKLTKEAKPVLTASASYNLCWTGDNTVLKYKNATNDKTLDKVLLTYTVDDSLISKTVSGDVTTNTFDVSVESGYFKAFYLYNASTDNYSLISNPSEVIIYKKALKPTITLEDQKFKWTSFENIDNAYKYTLLINNEEFEISDVNTKELFFGLNSTYNLSSYTISLTCTPKDEKALTYFETDSTSLYTIKRISDVSNIRVNNTLKNIEWDSPTDPNQYLIIDENQNEYLNDEKSYSISKNIGSHTIMVKPYEEVVDNTYYINLGEGISYSFNVAGISKATIVNNIFEFDVDSNTTITGVFKDGNTVVRSITITDNKYDPLTDAEYLFNRSKVTYDLIISAVGSNSLNTIYFDELKLSFTPKKFTTLDSNEISYTLSNPKEIDINEKKASEQDSYKRRIDISVSHIDKNTGLSYQYKDNGYQVVNELSEVEGTTIEFYSSSNKLLGSIDKVDSYIGVDPGYQYNIKAKVKADLIIKDSDYSYSYYLSSNMSNTTSNTISVVGIVDDFSATVSLKNNGYYYVYIPKSTLELMSNSYSQEKYYISLEAIYSNGKTKKAVSSAIVYGDIKEDNLYAYVSGKYETTNYEITSIKISIQGYYSDLPKSDSVFKTYNIK